MSHTPYGYIVVDGLAVVDEVEAANVRKLFQLYVYGMSLQAAANEAGIDRFHRSIATILKDKRYLGKGVYPKIIAHDVYDEAQKKLNEQKEKYKRKENSKTDKYEVETKFQLPKLKKKYSDDPYEQAEYISIQIQQYVITVALR